MGGVLERGYDRAASLSAVGPGWARIINRLWDAIEASPEREHILVAQVKEKFGGLRFYADGLPDGIAKLVEQAERESEQTCDRCGRPGKLRDFSWMRTLCDACAMIHRLKGRD